MGSRSQIENFECNPLQCNQPPHKHGGRGLFPSGGAARAIGGWPWRSASVLVTPPKPRLGHKPGGAGSPGAPPQRPKLALVPLEGDRWPAGRDEGELTARAAFPNARLSRKPNGVLEVVLHTDGGKPIFNGRRHEQFVELFHVIGKDRERRSPEGFDFFSPQGYDKILRGGPQGAL
jgi:hypothetical protein